MEENEISKEYDWLKKEVKKLVEIAEPLREIYPETFYETGVWSIVKLLALRRFVDIYTKIIKSERQKRFFENMFYIDLLAGSGLCRVGKKGDVVAGSALIACMEAYNPFDQHFIVERDPEKANAVEERIKLFTQDYKLFNCDCNDCVDEILAEIPEKSHVIILWAERRRGKNA